MARWRSRRLITLGVSLALHVGVLLALQAGVTAQPWRIEPVEQSPLVWIDATPPQPAHTPPTPLKDSSRAPAIPAAKKSRPVAPVVAAPTREQVDAPRAIDVTNLPEGLTVLPSTGTEEAPRGRTWHPEDMPRAANLLTEEQERVSARVGDWLGRDLAASRVRGGLLEPAYGQLGAELRAATDDVPKFIDTDSAKAVLGAVLESWGAGAVRYAKTGAPYAEPEGRLEKVEKPSAIAEAAGKGGTDAMAMASFLAAGARLQEFADGRAGLELYALVEIRQQSSGAFASANLVRPSGLKPFDAWVTERARHVGLAFSLDAGTPHALRSLWRFDGIIQYRRKLKAKEMTGRVALGMMTMAALSLLSSIGNATPPGTGGPVRQLGVRMPGMSGRFDEMTGELDIVDLTNPTYDCRVTLLEAE